MSEILKALEDADKRAGAAELIPVYCKSSQLDFQVRPGHQTLCLSDVYNLTSCCAKSLSIRPEFLSCVNLGAASSLIF